MIRLRRVWVDRQHFFVNCYLTLPPRLSHSVRVIIDERAKIKGERGSENSNRYFVGGWERASALDSNSILDRSRCLRAILRGKTRRWRHRHRLLAQSHITATDATRADNQRRERPRQERKERSQEYGRSAQHRVRVYLQVPLISRGDRMAFLLDVLDILPGNQEVRRWRLANGDEMAWVTPVEARGSSERQGQGE